MKIIDQILKELEQQGIENGPVTQALDEADKEIDALKAVLLAARPWACSPAETSHQRESCKYPRLCKAIHDYDHRVKRTLLRY